MSLRNNTYAKIIIFLVALLIPIMVLYSLSNRVSVNVLKKEIKTLNQKDLSSLAYDINTIVSNLSKMAYLLSEDINILQLQHLHLIENAYERNEQKSRLLERLRLLNVTERWDTQFSVMAPQINEIVSTNYRVKLDMDELKRIITPEWQYKEMQIEDYTQMRFVRHITNLGSSITNPEEAGLIVEVSFPKEYLIKELDNFKLGGKGDPILVPSIGWHHRESNS